VNLQICRLILEIAGRLLWNHRLNVRAAPPSTILAVALHFTGKQCSRESNNSYLRSSGPMRNYHKWTLGASVSRTSRRRTSASSKWQVARKKITVLWARSLTLETENLRTCCWVSLNSGEEREDVRRRARPPTRNRPPPPQVGAVIRHRHRVRIRRPLCLQILKTARIEMVPRATHGRYVHYRGGPMPESRYWRLEMKLVIYEWVAERREVVVRTPVIDKRDRKERLGIRKRWHDRSRSRREQERIVT
jgi:hypothetical protein